MHEEALESQIILPKQFADLHRRKDLSPEQRLLFAVLSDAVSCYGHGPVPLTEGMPNSGGHYDPELFKLHRSSRRSKLRVQAATWIASDSEAPFSFLHCCAGLSIDPDYLRKGLLQMGSTKIPRMRPSAVARRSEISAEFLDR